jgi:hypothetical protein
MPVSFLLRAALLLLGILVVLRQAPPGQTQEKKAVLEGTWKGALLQETFLIPAFVISMEFTQKGEKVSGTLRSEVRGKSASFAVMSFTGTLKGRTFTFQAHKFLERKPLPNPGTYWVLPAGKLKLSTDDAALEGPWTGAKGVSRRLSKGTMVVRNAARMVLKAEDLKRAARALGGEPGCIVAVGQVESAGRGFLPSGLPAIRFDAHEFSRLTSQKYDLSHGSISSKKPDSRPSKLGEQEYDRLVEALKLDKRAALEATAWGRFQILGKHHQACGYDTVEEFVKAMHESEAKQLDAFLAYLKNKGLDRPLREKRWADFARGWYGKDIGSAPYARQLEEAYNKYVKEKMR